jgi:hypothetical protein
LPKLYKSSSGGTSWTQVGMSGFPGSGLMPYAILFDQNDRLYIAGGTGLIYTSANYGQSFTLSNSGIPTGCYVSDLVKGPGQSVYGFGFYYSTSYYVYSPRVYVSINGGANWSVISTSGLENLKIGNKGAFFNNFLFFNGNDTYDYYLTFRSALPTAPLVSTSPVTDILDIFAVAGGVVTSTPQVLSRGVCWSTNTVPTVTDNVVNAASSAGSFTVSLTGLSPATTYYVRAFASNSVGTTYGNEETFTTLDFTGIASRKRGSDLEIYPVPSPDFVYLNFPVAVTAAEYSISDVLGNIVLASQLNEGEKKLDIRNLPVGCYYLRVKGVGNAIVVRE